MFINESFFDILLMALGYAYILFIILISKRLSRDLHISERASRKFVHAMIGNLLFIIPFFKSNIYPILIAAPFVLLTFLASPYSPSENVRNRLSAIAEITEEGHLLGLVLYAISYTILAFLFSFRPHLVAAGILPMAYGDSAAALVGERYGRRSLKLFSEKSLEGSIAMFIVSFIGIAISLFFFSAFYSFSVVEKFLPALAAAGTATLVEVLSPMGFDNLTVPLFGSLTFLALEGGL
jgi:dolichol kinase